MKARAVKTVRDYRPRADIGRYRMADLTQRKHPYLDLWLAKRVVAGMAPAAIVVASGGAVCIRTAYRWRKQLRGLQVVEVDGYRATYALRHNLPPSRLTAWEPTRIESVA